MRFTHYITEARELVKDWNDYIKSSKMLFSAVTILNKINSKGYKAYIVGGAVRDVILGNDKPKDIDIATNMPMVELAMLWKIHDIGKSKDFGIVVAKEGGHTFEIAQFREDGSYKDGRRPESVKITGSFEGDAARRDFTINAMGINAKGEIIDYFDGKRDIVNKVIRTVGDPRKRFGEDYLRMLRAGRFSASLDMDIEKETKKTIKKMASNIQDLSPERIRDELFKSASMGGDIFANYIKVLDELKLLKFILPEVANLKYFKHNFQHHPEGDVWQHTMAALKTSGAKDPVKNLAILLHDVGKGVTLSHKEGLPKYLGHAEEGVKLVNVIADRLKMSTKEKQQLLFAVGNHMKFHKILKMKPSKIAKLVADENWDVLVTVARADEFARGDAFIYAGEFEKIVDKCIKIKEKHGLKQVNKQLKLVDGNRVMTLTGLKQGPKIGEIIRKVTTEILDKGITNQELINTLIKREK